MLGRMTEYAVLILMVAVVTIVVGSWIGNTVAKELKRIEAVLPH